MVANHIHLHLGGFSAGGEGDGGAGMGGAALESLGQLLDMAGHNECSSIAAFAGLGGEVSDISRGVVVVQDGEVDHVAKILSSKFHGRALLSINNEESCNYVTTLVYNEKK